MSKDVRVKLKLKGLNELMTSAPVQSLVNEKAAKVSAAAGSKYEMIVQGKRRSKRTARAYVQPKEGVVTTDSDQRRLLGGLDAARG